MCSLWKCQDYRKADDRKGTFELKRCFFHSTFPAPLASAAIFKDTISLLVLEALYLLSKYTSYDFHNTNFMLIFFFLLVKASLIATVQDLFIISHHNIKTNSIHYLVKLYILCSSLAVLSLLVKDFLHCIIMLVAINVFVMICLVWFLNVFCMFVQLLIWFIV